MSVAYALFFYGLYCIVLYIVIIDNLRFNYYQNYPTISFVGRFV